MTARPIPGPRQDRAGGLRPAPAGARPDPGQPTAETNAASRADLRRAGWTQLQRRPAAWLVLLLAALVSSAVFMLSDSTVAMPTVTFCVCVAATLLVGAGWWRERRHAPDGDPLIGLAFVALLLSTVAAVGFAGSAVALDATLPVPSVVDALFFGFYGLFAVLLWRLGGRSKAESRRQFLDTLIVSLGAMPVVWVRLVEPQLHELRRLSESLSHQATHDALTGLANRALLNERLSDVLSPGTGAPTSVLLLDVDDFKLVNDSLGHAVGDLLLVEVARRIELELDVDDRAGRLGGDEFVAILDHADAEQAQALAERLLVSLAQPILLGETAVSVSVSVGIATSNEVREGLNLLGAADMAMYLAKKRGKAGTAMFQAQMQESANQRLALEIDLRRAVRNEELFLAYQPIVDLKTGGLAGVEALVRWQDATHGKVSPEVFIPIAERTGLILALGAWVLRESVAQMMRWDQQAPQSGLVVNVNVSTRELERPGLLAIIDKLIAEGLVQADPEITETALTLDGEAAAETLHELRARGVRLAVDDFGTGYSSLSRLQAAPVSQLKIDRSFVSEIQTAASPVPIIDATVAMADGLGLGVVAEGIETSAQLQYLRRLGCAHAQGYLLARPQDAQGITELLAGALPWADILAATSDEADRRGVQHPQLFKTLPEPQARSAAMGAAERDLQPSQVIQAAEAIAAVAAAEVAADAAVTAQAAVTAACAAALQASQKAARVAAQAAEAAAGAAAALAATANSLHPQQLWDPTTVVSELFACDSYTAEEAARDLSARRTAKAAASAVLKVAAKVESVATAAAAASAQAAVLIEVQLAEDAAAAASTVNRSTPHIAAGFPRVDERSSPG